MPGLSGYFTKSRAYLVGIENYPSARLYTPVNDVTLIASVLLKHEFKEADIVVATDIDKHGFEKLVDRMQTEISENDRVLFYFAGHGIAFEHDRPRGFLLPVNAMLQDESSFINLAWLMKELNRIRCRHFLLVLDCCFAGTVRWADTYRGIVFNKVKKLYREKFERFITDVSWQVITSSSYDEEALDSLLSLGNRDDPRIKYSPFAKIYADLLDSNAPLFPDGVITTIRLYNELEERLSQILHKNKPSFKQSPAYFPLQKHRKGQFIFLQPGQKDRSIEQLPLRGATNPYKGLYAYGDNDRHLFFGRDKAILELSALITQNKRGVIVVTGASGIGKSSLLHAGIKPLIQSQFPVFISCRPSQIKTNGGLITEIRQQIFGNEPCLVILDQYEELVTVCNKKELQKWKSLLYYLEQQPNVLLIISVRIDFEVQMEYLLSDLFLSYERYVVAPLQRHEVEAVILQPALQAAIEITPVNGGDQDELINRIIDEAMQTNGSLPLLSYLLEEWYVRSARQDPFRMPEQIYKDLGGVSGVLARIMERLLANLSNEDKELLRDILVRMVAITDTAFARKRVPEDEFDYADAGKKRHASRLLNILIEYRIIASDAKKEPETAQPVYYEPTHDAVINSWLTLHKWINDEREKIKIFQRLAEDTRRWINTDTRQKDILWGRGIDLFTVLNDMHRTDGGAGVPVKISPSSTLFGWSRYLGTLPASHSFLNKNEKTFLEASVRKIRIRRNITMFSILAILVAVVWTSIVLNNNRRANEALFINSTSEGSSPSEKLLMLKKAFDLDPDQQVTKDNIVRLLNLSPSFFSPFASHIIYHRGNNARNIIRNDHNGEYLTTADSSVVWWSNHIEKKREFKENTVIADAGFLHDGSHNMYYLTFTGELKIFGNSGEPVNARLIAPDGAYTRTFGNRRVLHVSYSNSLNKFLVVSANSSGQPGDNILVSLLTPEGNIVRHDTLPKNKISSFIVMVNEPAGELYCYDTQWLLCYNFGTRSFHQYELYKEQAQEGVIDLTKGPQANDFPVFRFAASGKTFFYKPFKDSCFTLSVTPGGPVITKRSSDIRDAVFVGATSSLLAITGNGVEVIEEDGTVSAGNQLGANLVSVNAFGPDRYYVVDDTEGNVYLLNEYLSPQLQIDKSYNIEKSTVSRDYSTLLLTSRTGAFYLFNLKSKNYLMKAGARSQVLPLPAKAGFVTWGADDGALEIVQADGNSHFFDTDTSIIKVWTNTANDSLFVITEKSYYILTPKGRQLVKKPFTLFSFQEDIVPLRGAYFIVYYDSVLRRYSNDLQYADSLLLHDEIEDVFVQDDGIVLLTKKGGVSKYDSRFSRKWHFTDARLSVKYVDDKIIYRPPLVYKLNTAGEYIYFDTAGHYQGQGNLARNTSVPGGNYSVNPLLDNYLFSPPNQYNNLQTIAYDNILYDRSGNQLFNYRFNKAVTGEILDEDRLLFQAHKDYEIFTQFTPAGAFKRFKQITIQLADASR